MKTSFSCSGQILDFSSPRTRVWYTGWNFVYGVFCGLLFFEVLVTEYVVHRSSTEKSKVCIVRVRGTWKYTAKDTVHKISANIEHSSFCLLKAKRNGLSNFRKRHSTGFLWYRKIESGFKQSFGVDKHLQRGGRISKTERAFITSQFECFVQAQ